MTSKLNRRNFLQFLALSGGGAAAAAVPALTLAAKAAGLPVPSAAGNLQADLVIAGGGLGGCAAALAALRNGLRVILTEETGWIGGQLTQQGVPPDEHRWIETHGATQLYRDLREGIRNYYRQHYPLTDAARSRRLLNPGDGSVSALCHEPRVALAVLYALLAPYLSNGKLTSLLEHKATGADVSGDKVRALKMLDRRSGQQKELNAPYFIDATELGDLLPLTGTEFVTGAEARSETKELHAAEKADPDNQQAFTYCLAMDYVAGEDHRISKPREYDFWRSFVPPLHPSWSGKLLDLAYSNPHTLTPKMLGFQPEGVPTGHALNLWNYRRIIHAANFRPGAYAGDISIINWPQNDYLLGNLTGVGDKAATNHMERAKQLSLSLFYWLQTEAPRPDGKQGWPGLRLRGDVLGTEDGLAKYPYIRESRRIRAVFTILEEHVGAANRALITGSKTGNRAFDFYDSVGVGYYHIDLHPTSRGNNYIDFDSLPFQIPLGALLPVRMGNLLPAGKNIGTTHITNGCYRLHPVEWGIGEAAGMLAAYALQKKILPRGIREKKPELTAFQDFIRAQGIETRWPEPS